MLRRGLIIAVSIFFAFTTAAQYKQGASWTDINDSEVVTKLKAHVDYLASPLREGRAPGSSGEWEAADYLQEVLAAYGVEVLESGQEFGISRNPGDTLISRNVVGIVQGADSKLKNHYIVVGARLDNIGKNELMIDGESNTQIYRGANGNASGLALMMELAKMISLSSTMFRRSIIFVGFGASNQTFAGSWYFLNRSFPEAANVDAMINLDMLGVGDGMYAYTAANEDMNLLLGRMKELLQPILPTVTAVEPYPSDHRSFYASQIPSVFFSSGKFAEYNTVKDLPSILDYQMMERELEYVYNFSRELANRDVAPAFSKDDKKRSSALDRLYSFSECDKKPSFMNRTDPRYFLQNWVYQYLRYPEKALKEGLQGRVNVQFTIEADGSISDIRILKTTDDLFSDEVKRVIAASPRWKPGIVSGERVRTYIVLPVDFMLEKKSKRSFGLKK